MLKRIAIAVSAVILLGPALAAAAPVVFEASGATPDDIKPSVDAFRDALGTLNPNQPGSFPSGRREINWDGVPDAFSAPNNEESAMEPRPTPHCRKNHRRVTSLAYSHLKSCA